MDVEELEKKYLEYLSKQTDENGHIRKPAFKKICIIKDLDFTENSLNNHNEASGFALQYYAKGMIDYDTYCKWWAKISWWFGTRKNKNDLKRINENRKRYGLEPIKLKRSKKNGKNKTRN